MRIFTLLAFTALLIASCAQTHVKEHKEWETVYKEQGISNACFMIRDHAHDVVHYYNHERCVKRFLPASTFKIFNSLAGLETAVAPDEQLVIKWDSVRRWNSEWDHDMNMREAFKLSSVAYYQELARRIGPDYMQHYLDTVRYGNQRMGGAIDLFWLNDTLQISADEQVGFVKRLYFDELPFSERSQRIVRSLMLWDETPEYKLYYKTGTGEVTADSMIYWIVGFAEKIEHVKEHKESMNKSDVRNYPYFFAQNFTIAQTDSSKNWFQVRKNLLYELLGKMQIIPAGRKAP